MLYCSQWNTYRYPPTHRLRAPLSDLWEGHTPSWTELGVLALLAGAAPLHSLGAGYGPLAHALGLGPEQVRQEAHR